MKRFLSAMLCAVLLMGILPGAASAASWSLLGTAPERVSIRDAWMTMSRTYAYVGDKIEFDIGGVEALGNVYYQWAIKRDTGSDYIIVFKEDEPVLDHHRFVYYPVSPGAHFADALIKDDVGEEFYSSDDFIVRLRAAPKIASVEAISGTSLKISWNKVMGATGYEVWRSPGKTGEYKLVKTTTALSFTNTYLKTGLRYYYEIRTYNRVSGLNIPSSNFSAIRTGVPLGKTTISTVTSPSAKRLNVHWTKVTGATGYIVYRSTSKNGIYAKIQTTTALSFTNTGLTGGKTYYYKIKPYKSIASTNYYGPLSGYKSAKVKK